MNNAGFLSKIKFFLKRQRVVVVLGKEKEIVSKTIYDTLKKNKRQALIFESEDEDILKLRFFLERSRKPILVITEIGDTSYKNMRNTLKLIKSLPRYVKLVLNFDNKLVRGIKDLSDLNTLTYGFYEGADFTASDVIKLNNKTNFKVNYKGNVVPIWLSKNSNKKEVYSILSAVSVGTLFNLNLIEMSQCFKELI